MNKEVNFEIAKLLKEKGYPQLNRGIYYTKDKAHCLVGWGFNDRTEDSLAQYSAPTIAEVKTWLYDTYGIWIYIKQSTARLGFMCFIQRLNTLGEEDIQNDERYTLSEEAYEAAIKYVLENLI